MLIVLVADELDAGVFVRSLDWGGSWMVGVWVMDLGVMFLGSCVSEVNLRV